MKQFLTVFFCLFLSITGYAENKIKMVTYFPVPYVAYSKVNVTKQLDVGLTSACSMNLGCTESGNAGLRPLNVTNGVVQKGRLDLNTAAAVSGSTASIGSGSGSGSMNFNSNLRVNTLNDGLSVETNQLTVDTLKLFPNRITTDFPSCASTGAPGTPNISWQKLKLKDKEEVYLMCGNPQEEKVECTGAKSKWDGERCVCPGANDFYVTSTHACCSDSTPKTNYQCWTPKTTATWDFYSSGVRNYSHPSENGYIYNCNNLIAGISECEGLITSYDGNPNNAYRVLPSYSSIKHGNSCSPSGKNCIYQCTIINKKTAIMNIGTCLGKTEYQRKWDPAIDKNY